MASNSELAREMLKAEQNTCVSKRKLNNGVYLGISNVTVEHLYHDTITMTTIHTHPIQIISYEHEINTTEPKLSDYQEHVYNRAVVRCTDNERQTSIHACVNCVT